MMLSVWILVLFSVSGPTPPPARSRVRIPWIQSLEKAQVQGELSEEQVLQFRQWSVTSPEKLPQPWRELWQKQKVPAHAATAILVENFQWRKTRGLRNDAWYPPVNHYLDSETFPLRIVYPSPDFLDQAEHLLAAAEFSWQLQIHEWGFWQPPIDTPEGRYRVYLDDTGMGGGGYLYPVDFYQDTPWDDCTSFVVVDRQNAPMDMEPVVAHELNHAMQGAMDCLESINFWENTATFIMAETFEYGRAWQDAFLPYFQGFPQESVAGGDYEDPELAYFWYGAFLWPHFLGGMYGGTEPPAVLIRRVWEHSVQESGGYENTVSYLQAMEQVLSEHSDTTLHEAFVHFGRSRMLMGAYIDSPLADMPAGNEFFSDHPPFTSSWLITDKSRYQPWSMFWPEPYGTNYFKIYRTCSCQFVREITLTLSTTNADPWVLLWVDPATGEFQNQYVEEGMAQMTFEPRAASREWILAVMRLAPTGFHSDTVMEGASYTLEMGPTIPDPELIRVTPYQLKPGQTVDLTIQGRFFVEGMQVEFTPAVLTAGEVLFVDEETLQVQVTVDKKAAAGILELKVIHPGADPAWLSNALEILELPKKTGKVGCATDPARGSSPAPVGFFLLLACLMFFSRRFFRS